MIIKAKTNFIMSHNKEEYHQKWLAAYNELNDRQREAVDTIDGPVMTIAGPGTGKTQLLAVRIGNILNQTDALPSNILCLTFTDAGAVEMRNRLARFIGSAAYNVSIFTFHSFCSAVMKENASIFNDFRELSLVSDLEKIEIVRQIIDGFDDSHPLKKYKGDPYSSTNRMINLFQTMKKESWLYQDVQRAYDDHIAYISDPLNDAPTFVCKRATGPFKKGDLRTDKVQEEKDKFQPLLAAAKCLSLYKKSMAEMYRYDFEDMVLMVIDKFETNDALLGKYQERYLYTLVDEYQDTNGAQNKLIFLLSSFWDQPNLFIVGDDDQSIYKFQGANMGSIIDFKEKYDPKEIVLINNYRSSQIILDKATMVIHNNGNRLSNLYAHINKNLIESRPMERRKSIVPLISQYQTVVEEEAGVIQKIQALHASGIAYREIAVLYTKHIIADNFIKYFSQKGIPYNVKKSADVLTDINAMKLMSILQYLSAEYKEPFSGEHFLFEVLHYDYFELSPLDIAKIINHFRTPSIENDIRKFRKLRGVIADKKALNDLDLVEPERVYKVAILLDGWINAIPNMTLQVLIEKILTEGNVLNYILSHPDHTWKLEVINTFFDFVKNEAQKNKDFTIHTLVEVLDVMKTNDVRVPITQMISNEDGVNLMTIYGSKGLEFAHVFMVNCTSSNWEKKGGGNFDFSFPPNIVPMSKQTDHDDLRRLWFVAMTRAKDYLYISYPSQTEDGKPITATVFVMEMISSEEEIIATSIAPAKVIAYKTELMRFAQGSLQLLDKSRIEKVLSNFKMNVSALNKYLDCKLAFYFERILRIPQALNYNFGFGLAIHYAFENFFLDMEASNPRTYGSVANFVAFFEKGLEAHRHYFTKTEFENYRIYGQQTIEDYHANYCSEWFGPKAYIMEHSVSDVELRGVPLTGKLDRIDVYDDHVVVTDFKTGNYKGEKKNRPNDKSPLGGDYWRQVVFYKILLDSDPRTSHNMRSGIIDWIEGDKNKKFNRDTIVVTAEDIAIVSNQIIEAYTDINNHTFEPGCNEDDCQWCNFVKHNMPITYTENQLNEE